MTAPRDPDVLIREFLGEGQTELPDRAFEAVRQEINRTRQRAVIGPWRQPDMPTLARVAIAAAAVVAVVLAWGYVRPTDSQVGGRATPTSTPDPTPDPTPQPLPNSQPLEPGRYRFDAVPPNGTTPFLITITMPQGWVSYQDFAVDKNYGPGDSNAGASFVVWDITNRYVDPCTDHTLLDPAPGPGIDELIASLASQPGIEASPPTDVTVDGYRGKSIELTVTTDIGTCPGGFWIWGDPEARSTPRERTRSSGSTSSTSMVPGARSLPGSRRRRRPPTSPNS